jgi:hypothetical protein
MVKKRNVKAIFGPTCSGSAQIVGSLSDYQNIPVFLWTTVSSELRDKTRYSTIVNSAGTINNLVTATFHVLAHFNWTEVGFVYNSISLTLSEYLPLCQPYAQSFKLFSSYTNVSTYTKFSTNPSIAGFQSTLSQIKSRARVILACLDKKEHRRNLMIAANLNNMVGPDYVYIFIQTSATGFGE